VDADIKYDPKTRQLTCSGEWTLAQIPQIEKKLKKFKIPRDPEIILDGSQVTQMDSAGAFVLLYWLEQIKNLVKVQMTGFSDEHDRLLKLVQKQKIDLSALKPRARDDIFVMIGKWVEETISEVVRYFSFIGELSYDFLRTIFNLRLIRWNAISSVIEKTGYHALPIIALLSYMIGVVLAYQMGNQLRKYGANVFIVDLLGLSVLREFGPLITAIMVAGRTGSAFAAQLGIMKINQEIDALNTMGVTPGTLLLLPRIFGLVIVLPLLTIWADFFGVLGGMCMAQNMLGISFSEFIHRFQQEIPLRAFLIGIGKAPVFALIISSVGCFEGMRVRGSAESVGERTTSSVVISIFFIIVVDAIFSVIFSKLQL
jgi:phospholipid/cholesterol/gamma-HCH transport system permease protein